MNTAATPVTTAEVAKQQCTEYVKTHLKEPQDEQ